MIIILPISLFWGRFSTLIFIDKFKYLTLETKSISVNHKNYWHGFRKESLVSIIFIFFLIFYFCISNKSPQLLTQNLLMLLIGFFVSSKIPKILGIKIGGFNGDSCGASVILVETTMLFIYANLL